MTREHIRPHVHEAKTYLHFGDNDLSPFWALRNLVLHEHNGHGEITTEIGNDVWHISIGYSDSGIAPRPSDGIQRDVLRDWELHLDGPGEAKAHYQIRARYDDMRGPDGDTKSIPWPGGEGLDILAQTSNIPLDHVPKMLRHGLIKLAEAAGTTLNKSYFGRPLPSSNVTTVEFYVRYRRQYASKMVRSDGVLYRLMHLLADEKGTEWVFSADNKDIVGHRHAFELCPESVSMLGPDLSAGVRLKSYHPKHVRRKETEDDPLSSPKYGVAFHKSVDGESRPWSERDELRHELEDILINTLEWAEIPTEPDPTTYVSDWHFDAEEASEVVVGRRSDPTPELEAKQDSILLRVLSELTPGAREATKALATEGGTMHYEDLAEETDSSVSTIYRILDEMKDVIKSDRGMVKFTSEKIRQDIVGMVERLNELKQSTAKRVAELANIDLRSRADSALEKWMAKYGANLVDIDTSSMTGTVRFDTMLSRVKSDDNPQLEQVLEEGLEAWKSPDRDPLLFKEFRFKAEVRMGNDGKRIGSVIGW